MKGGSIDPGLMSSAALADLTVVPEEFTLVGPLARAYLEFREAAAELEARQQAYALTQERYRVALGRFSRLAAGTGADSAG